MIRKKKVAALCKKLGRLYVVTAVNGVQWVGYGTTFYKMEGMPQMKPVEYAAAFDFSEKDINNSIIEDYGSLGDFTNDDCAEEIIVVRLQGRNVLLLCGTRTSGNYTRRPARSDSGK
ncbi:MAG: hypothetical protein J1F28_04365 [Oscillospiraceae bacterium]|nr:hypothetical protein [Oscillospiraceae bacterium]